jgi:uncharacterized protein (TIGR02246 family)
MRAQIITLALAVAVAACTKSASSTADTGPAAASAPADRTADEAAILAIDSGWMRQVIAKNVDSLMTYYTPDAVSYGFGPPASGADRIRALYTDFVKSSITNPKINSNPAKFSDDGMMAYDYGTYAMTITPPGGKATNESGAYLNVLRKVDGQWKLVAEMSTPIAVPKN